MPILKRALKKKKKNWSTKCNAVFWTRSWNRKGTWAENLMKSQGSLKFSQRYCICVNFLVLSNGQPWYKRLTLEEAGWRVHSNSLCNFSVSWKLLLVAESCPSLPNSMDCSLPGSSVQGILQARILEWVSISFSRGSSQPRDRIWVSFLVGGFFTTELPGKFQV